MQILEGFNFGAPEVTYAIYSKIEEEVVEQ
jgi:hypothetical protein